jgi:hypothetical protein
VKLKSSTSVFSRPTGTLSISCPNAKASADAVPFTVVVISLECVTERRALSIQMCDIQRVRSAVRLEISFGAKDAHVHNVRWVTRVPQPRATDPTFAEDPLDLAKE